MDTAHTILQQLGGNRFITMTGAKDMVGDDRSLQFRIGRNSSKANMVKVTLRPSDTYRVEFLRYARLEVKPVKTIDGIFAEQLQSVFSDTTGLACSL